MEKGLGQVGAISGVGGSFLCDNRGDVIASSDPAALATVTMRTIGREVGHLFLALETAGRPADRVDFFYDSWRLLAYDIGDAVLFVVCQPEADLAIVRMTVDVITAAWRGDADVRKRLQRHRAERAALLSRASAWPNLVPKGQPASG